MAGTGQPSPVGDHAVVLGASIAGLAAAASLARRFARVTIVERDPPPSPREARRGVPQGRHLHVLLPAGLRALGELLPGLADALQARGGHVIPAPEFRFFVGSGRLALRDHTLAVTGATRPLLEGTVREQVAGHPNVSFLDGRVVDGLVADETSSRVVGVRVAGADGGTVERLDADLVVDATGRASHSPDWLAGLGYQPPSDERMEVGVHYSTRLFHRDPVDLDGSRLVAITPPPGIRRGGLALAVEDDRWLVTLVGTVGERPPTGLADFVDYAAGLWQPDLHQIVEHAEPDGAAATGGFRAHRRLRYDALRRFPERLVVTGDALCSLSPAYGQGMTVAACEARILGETLDRHGLDRVGQRFFRQSRSVVETAWTLATSADLADPGIEGRRNVSWRLLNRYIDRAMRAATDDPVVADAVLAVNGLVAPPASLLAPRVATRLLGRLPRHPTAAIHGAAVTSAPERRDGLVRGPVPSPSRNDTTLPG